MTVSSIVQSASANHEVDPLNLHAALLAIYSGCLPSPSWSHPADRIAACRSSLFFPITGSLVLLAFDSLSQNLCSLLVIIHNFPSYHLQPCRTHLSSSTLAIVSLPVSERQSSCILQRFHDTKERFVNLQWDSEHGKALLERSQKL